ncbi:MAG: hypothetical protein ACI4GY_02010 [Acutalibacteraceae bacterium]
MSAVLEHKCPCCGGAVQFDSASQKLKCPYCDTEFDVEALKQAEEPSGEDSVNWNSTENEWQAGEEGSMAVYTCKSCGGEIVCDSTTSATSCPYCGNPVAFTGNLSGSLRPDVIIPFKLDKKAAKAALEKHVRSNKFVPKIFKDKNHIDEIKGVYVPHWLFSGESVVDGNFSGENSRSWSDANFNYTETEYYDVQTSGSMLFNNIPVDGSKKMDDDLMESIEPFDLSEGVDFNTAYLAGYLADKYDVGLEESMPRANERIRQSASEALRRTVDGYGSVTPKSVHLKIENGYYKYALYPVWILNTSWKGQKFTFAMNGQTGKFVGDLPLDKSKYWKMFTLLGAGLSALFYALLWIIELM